MNEKNDLRWHALTSVEQLKGIGEESNQKPVLIFKHSTRCSTSAMVLHRLERNWNRQEMHDVKAYFLDLLSYREVSHQVAALFQVEHESPQVIIILKGQPVYNRSHLGINYSDLKEIVAS